MNGFWLFLNSLLERVDSVYGLLTIVGVVGGYLRLRGVNLLEIIKSLGKLPATVALVKATHEQTMTNHGSTLRDDVKAIRQGFETHERRFQSYQDADGVATFYADGSGRLYWTSTGLEELFGVAKRPELLLGHGMLDFVIDEERNPFGRRWKSCYAECRVTFDCNAEIRRIVNEDTGETQNVWVRVVATFVGPNEYSGHVRTVDTK